MKTIFSLFFIAQATILCAQTPLQVISVFPAAQTVQTETDVTLAIRFNAPLDPLSVTPQSFKVFGRWSGPAAGVFSLDSNNTLLHFKPNQPFFAGELVAVSANKLLHSSSGDTLEKSYVWSFWIRTQPGSLQQTLLTEISLRLPGEGLLQTYGAYAGDLNNDGYSDLTAVNETADDLRILLNDGAGAYTGGFTVLPMGMESPSPSEGGDFDGDGEIDLVVTTAHGGETRVLFGDGAGAFPVMDAYITGEATRGVGVLDLEGDGDDDIVVVNRDDNNANLLWNDGTGHFSVTTFDPPGLGETALAITDANADGSPDLIVGYYTSKRVAVLLGDGQGGFVLSNAQDVTGQPWMIAAGDLNGDGFADVASANSSGHNVAVLFGDGQGGLGAPVNYPNIGTFPLSIDLGDVDGDGDLDIVTSQYGSNDFAVIANNGDGSFALPLYLPSAENASCVILHDRDNDGDLDITGTDEGADVIRLFVNPGVSPTYEQPGYSLRLSAVPNPFTTSAIFTCDVPDGEAVFWEISDMTGRRTLTYKGFGTWTADTETWPPGMYRLRAHSGNATAVLKVLKL